MDDNRKTKAQLIDELNELRRRTTTRPSESDAATVARRPLWAAALRRVRHHLRGLIAAMATSDDLALVLAATRDGLRELGVPYRGLCVSRLEPETAPGQLTVTLFHEAYECHRRPDPVAINTLGQMRRVGGPVYRPDLDLQDPFGDRAQRQARGDRPARSLLDVPFAWGTLTVDSDVPQRLRT